MFPVPWPHFRGTAKEGWILSFLSLCRELLWLLWTWESFAYSDTSLHAWWLFRRIGCSSLLMSLVMNEPSVRTGIQSKYTARPGLFKYSKCTWVMQMKATNDPMHVYIMQQLESNRENNLLSTLDLYFQIEHFKWG